MRDVNSWCFSVHQSVVPVNFRTTQWWIEEGVKQDGTIGYTILFNEAEDQTPRFLCSSAWYSTIEEATAAAQEFFASSPVPAIAISKPLTTSG